MLNKTMLTMIAKLLGMASDEFHNHGCNDMYIDGTPENIEFVKRMIAASDDPVRVPHIIPKDTDKIFVMDVEVMDYCLRCIKEEMS